MAFTVKFILSTPARIELSIHIKINGSVYVTLQFQSDPQELQKPDNNHFILVSYVS